MTGWPNWVAAWLRYSATPGVRAIIFTGGRPDVLIRHCSVEETSGRSAALQERRASGLPDTRLARPVGTGKALAWVLRGRTCHPEAASREGLVPHHEAGDVLVAAGAMARQFRAQPATALTDIQQVLRASHRRPTAAGVDEDSDLFANLMAQNECGVDMMRQYVAGDHQLKKY
ncbi:MAG: hypothetical protein EXR83_01785 [Gammaproteobacteria bacterium]|nr:hypothetical protein [Gammaproteobacteria bacterium]